VIIVGFIQVAKVFGRLFGGYWNSEYKWRARGLLAFVIGLNFFDVYLLVLINSWYKEFYNALQEYLVAEFWPLLGEFTLLAMLHIVVAVYAVYLRQMVQIKWRTWMTDEYLARWLKRQVYYRMQVQGSDTDNPDQRISEDINQFVNLTLQLLIGLLKQMTTLAAFGVVLWNLSGAYTMHLGDKAEVFTDEDIKLFLNHVFSFSGIQRVLTQMREIRSGESRITMKQLFENARTTPQAASQATRTEEWFSATS
jgi:ABC-type uncharacterized transport system fused permease/ATPase subunit